MATPETFDKDMDRDVHSAGNKKEIPKGQERIENYFSSILGVGMQKSRYALKMPIVDYNNCSN